MDEQTKTIVAELTKAYWMELETVQNYLANATNLVGVRAEEIKQSLAGDITAEMGHAQELAQRLHVVGGQVPGSMAFKPEQRSMQPPDDPADVVAVI